MLQQILASSLFRILGYPVFAGTVSGALGLVAWREAKRRGWCLHLSQKRVLTVLLGLGVVYVSFFSWVGIQRYEAVASHMSDLASLDQLVWGTLHGHFMRETVVGIGGTTMLSYHVMPIMALFSPLYLVAPTPAVLIIGQLVGFGLAAIPVGLWAYKRLESGFAAVIAGLAVLLNPVMANDSTLLAQNIPLAIPCLAFALYFQLQKRWAPFWICLIMALSVREEIAFPVMAMGIYALIWQRQRMGWSIVGAGLLWAVVCLGFIIPHFNHGSGLYWLGSFGYLGKGSPGNVAAGAITHPLAILQHIVQQPRPAWVAWLIVPAGFLPLAGWRLGWLALPTLGYLLLGDGYYDPNSWYPSPLVPFLYFGAIEGIAVLRRFLPSQATASYLLGTAVLAYYEIGAGPGTLGGPQKYTVGAHAATARAMLATISPQASVAATPQLISHVSQRLDITFFPELLVPSDVFAIDFKGWTGWTGYPGNFNEHDQALRRVLRDPGYGDFYYGDGLLLVKRGEFPPAAVHPAAAELGGKIELLGYDAPDSLRAGQPLTVTLHWRAPVQLDQAYTISLQFGNEANGKVVQQDGWPWEGYYPTLEWPADREIEDPHTLQLPASLAPGQYRLYLSMYSLENGQAKPLITPDGASGVSIGPFTVEARAP